MRDSRDQREIHTNSTHRRMPQTEEEIRRRERRRRLQARRRAQVRRQRMLLAFCLLALVLLVVRSVTRSGSQESKPQNSKLTQITVAPTLTQEVTPTDTVVSEPEDATVHLVAVGDNIIHERVGNSGKSDTGVWSYDHLYQYIRDDIQAADLSLVVQETVFVENHADFSGYPNFGTPTEVGDALVNAGFDVVAQATNHMMDKGSEAVQFTVEWWKQNHAQIALLGIHENAAAAEEITVVECNSIRIAMLDYTELINFNPNMTGSEYLIDVYEENAAREDIRRARELADVVLVVMHAGVEYETQVDASVEEMVQVFLEEGVDIVIGSHPHVLRKMETLTRADGHKMLVYYSLGNFISSQNRLTALLGGMADLTIRKDAKTGTISIESAEMIPLITHYNHDTQTYAVYKLEDYTQELAAEHSAYRENPSTFSLNYYTNLFQSIVK